MIKTIQEESYHQGAIIFIRLPDYAGQSPGEYLAHFPDLDGQTKIYCPSLVKRAPEDTIIRLMIWSFRMNNKKVKLKDRDFPGVFQHLHRDDGPAGIHA